MNIRFFALAVIVITAACASADDPGTASGGTGGGGSAGGAATGGQGGQQNAAGNNAVAGNNGAGGGGSGQMGGQAGRAPDAGGCPADAPTSGLKLRFVASDRVMLAGESVAAWTDQITQLAATQAAAEKRPSVRANALNGKPVIRFDGEDDFLSFPFPVTGKDKLSVVTIARTWQYQRGAENNDCDFDKDGISDIGRELNCSGTDQTYLTWNEGGGGFKSSGIFLGLGQKEATFRFGTGRDYRHFKTPFVLEKPVNDAFVWSAAVLDGVWRTLYINNQIPRGSANYRDKELIELRLRADVDGEGATRSTWTGAVGDSESTAWLGRGRFPESTSFWAGEIAELLIYEAALSDADRAQLGRYVKCTYGL